jgi:2-keto-3-deoxy-L-rhamnonate aldolase RhmA
VPSHDGHWSSRVLDGGAQGVIVPHVNNRSEAEAVVRNCRFPPLGQRSVMGLGPALGYRAMPLGEINERLNAETAVIVMLETAEGIDNADAIAALPGIDVLLIGSGDLTPITASLARSITRGCAMRMNASPKPAISMARRWESAASATMSPCRAR